MDGASLTALASTGERMLALKMIIASMHCLWVYDYLLTFGDEIKYAWSGRRTWIFVLFIANRYTPVLYLTWINASTFSYTKSFCQKTKWMLIFHAVVATVLAQITIALRVYGVTGRNRLIGGALFVMVSAQISLGSYFLIRAVIDPIQSVPEIDLDAFKMCFYKRWQHGEISFTNLVIVFDLLTFAVIFVTAKRRGTTRHLGIPSILDTILRDATLYFICMFIGQMWFVMFLWFAPEEIQLIPGMVTVVFTPIMASRLMLSLKKAAIEPALSWSLETMTLSGHGTGTRPGVGTLHFASRTYDVSHQTSGTLTPPDEGDVELESTS
ncbi:hypothetical protein BDM02DRAFT_3116104 [Thelephora ganbajun]|uniref:Uncharacterized protein n=1 Tax=Thelephora ganbajun TaxID=370292 RepID=A0ACB6ZFB5_THEGA|nr:hypothetical protein BDM02DRAFT_3116104 [Thelephora ganbajun]